MKELSLHILDIAQNSIEANATLIEININEDILNNKLSIVIHDNGHGMTEIETERAINPFYTSRLTRKIGLGIPLLKSAAERCKGSFTIQSTLHVGTIVSCEFEYNHIDRAPIGKIEDTLLVLLNSAEKVDIHYTHKYNNQVFQFDTREIKKIMEGTSLANPDVLMWIKEYIKDHIVAIKSNA
ncbi:MAG: sensor histidine kinase [Tissierellales bacterium]|nr:sensor histidine kinase [Tissierellales bacterium]MBN2827839.1 sensor histidine kinase [Tissierellales bacterium]